MELFFLSGISVVLVAIYSVGLKILNVLKRLEKIKESEELEILKIRIKNAQNESKSQIYPDHGTN